jgi:hypothetical protein
LNGLSVSMKDLHLLLLRRLLIRDLLRHRLGYLLRRLLLLLDRGLLGLLHELLRRW